MKISLSILTCSKMSGAVLESLGADGTGAEFNFQLYPLKPVILLPCLKGKKKNNLKNRASSFLDL